MSYRQAQEQQEHQEWLIANPMSEEAHKYRAQLWPEFFKEKGNQATHAMPVSKENQNGFNRK
jgi:hypothetical protein